MDQFSGQFFMGDSASGFETSVNWFLYSASPASCAKAISLGPIVITDGNFHPCNSFVEQKGTTNHHTYPSWST